MLPGLHAELAGLASGAEVPWSVLVAPLAARWLAGAGPLPEPGVELPSRRASRAIARRFGRFPASFVLPSATPFARATVAACWSDHSLAKWAAPVFGFGLLEMERSARPGVLATLPAPLRASTQRAFEVARVRQVTGSDAPTGADAILRVAMELGGSQRALVIRSLATLFGDLWTHELSVISRGALEPWSCFPPAALPSRARIAEWWVGYFDAESPE